MKNISNPIYSELKKLKLIKDENLIKISSRTRDKKISVLKDKKSSIIFLEKYLTDEKYYSNVRYGNSPTKNSSKTSLDSKDKEITTLALDDDIRRAIQFKKIIKNKDVLDFGCGWGKFLNYVKKDAFKVTGVELRNECIKNINKNYKNISVFKNIEETNKKFDVITAFHVLEHIPFQVKTIKKIKSYLKPNGKLIIEVPHANDFLLSFEGLKEFKKFTFWSEHLILHTEKSLMKILKSSGLNSMKVIYHQRYNFVNHLGWFVNRKPGGHEFFNFLHNDNLNKSYTKYLEEKKLTDTIIVIAQK